MSFAAALDGALDVDSSQIKHPTLSTRAGEGTGLTLERHRQETGTEGNWKIRQALSCFIVQHVTIIEHIR